MSDRAGIGGRPKSLEPFVRKSIHIPAYLAAEFELLYFDPVYRKPKYGVWSEIVSQLIREHVDSHRKKVA